MMGISALAALVAYPFFISWITHHVPTIVFCSNVLLVEQFLDWGLANLLLLETLRHKTGLFSYISIRLKGGCTNRGGMATGSTASGEVDDDTRGKFYLFKDTFMGERRDCSQGYVSGGGHGTGVKFDPLAAIAPNTHAFLSARSSLSDFLFKVPYQNLEDGSHRWLKETLTNFWGFFMITAPSLKFRCTLQDLIDHEFKDDPMYDGLAWLTYKDCSASWIGPWGIVCALVRGLRQGFAREVTWMPSRAFRKIATGLIQLLFTATWIELVDVKVCPLALMLLPWL